MRAGARAPRHHEGYFDILLIYIYIVIVRFLLLGTYYNYIVLSKL